MAKKTEKLPITYAPLKAGLASNVRVTAGDSEQVLSQQEWKAFKAVADGLGIPVKPAKAAK